MTQEEKAKAYDEALERARNLHKDAIAMGENLRAKQCEIIFPELRESEDERIRKWIIDDIRYNMNNEPLNNSEYKKKAEKAIAWLEKQGKKSIDDLTPQEAMDVAVAKCFEQGEQKETLCDKCRKEHPSHSCQDITELGRCTVEHEQKPIDKVEPKFHEGDWVVYNNDICQIVKREEGCNKLVTVFGIEKELVNERNLSTARLWTIDDAKEGDVLAYVTDEEDLWIMIYWSLYAPYEGHVHYHALLVNDNFSDKGTCCICINDLKPATKEQRDVLFAKMKEDGYTFDFEKKELKKIKSQPSKWNISDFRTWQYIVSDVLTKYDGIGQYLDDGFCRKIAQHMQEEWSKKLSF